jgi:hypothetical protein
MLTQTYDLSITPNHSIVKVHASQWDEGERQFVFNLYNDSGLYEIPTGATVEIRGTKADGHGIAISTSTNPNDVSYSGSTVTVKTTKQMCACAGEQDFKINIQSGNKLLASARYTLVVDEDTLTPDTDISDSDIPTIIELAEEQLRQATMQAQLSKSYAQGNSESGRQDEDTDNAKYYKEQAAQIAEDTESFTKEAEAWARGTKDGSAVPSTDPTYNNNAKWYSEKSSEYADDSADSADDAEAWAKGTKGGSAVPSTDPTYNNNSKYYAEQSESFVDDAEAWARGSRNGTDVGSSDATYHNNSKYYSELAKSSADDSEDSAELAKSWAVGNSNSGRTGENTNNSKYWCTEAEDAASEAANYAAQAATYSSVVLPNFYINFTTMELMQDDAVQAQDIVFSLDENKHLLYEITV